MIRCEAPNCQMRSYNLTKEQLKLAKNNYMVSFHKFPDDPIKRKTWIKAARDDKWNPSSDSNLCSLHFGDNCFNENNELYDHAVPTIFFEDFRSHIRGIVNEFDLQSSFSDDENGKDDSKVHEIEEIIECNILSDSEDDVTFIGCEDVYVSGNETKISIENISTSEHLEISKPPKVTESKPAKMNKPGPLSSKLGHKRPGITAITSTPSKLPKKTVMSSAKVTPTINVSTAKITKPVVSAAVTPTNAASQQKTAVSQSTPGSKNQSTSTSEINPIDTLFKMVRSTSFTRFSITQPSTRNFIMHLLNLVRTANAGKENKNTSSINKSTYIITAKADKKYVTEDSKPPTVVDSLKLNHTVLSMINDMKEGKFKKPSNVSIICNSPGIFYITNVVVKNCPPNMDSVYVVTSENILPYVLKCHVRDLKNKPHELGKKSETASPSTPKSTQSTTNPSQTTQPNKKSTPTDPAVKPNSTTIAKSTVTQAVQNLKTVPITKTPNTSKPASISITTSPLSSSVSTTQLAKLSNFTSTKPTSSSFVIPQKANTTIDSQTNIPLLKTRLMIPSTNATVTTNLKTSATTPTINTDTSKFQIFASPSRPKFTTTPYLQTTVPSSTSTLRTIPMVTTTTGISAASNNRIIIPRTAIKSIVQPQSALSKSTSVTNTTPTSVTSLILPSTSTTNLDITNSRRSPTPEFTFQPIRPDTFNTNLTNCVEEILYPSPPPSTSKEPISYQRQWPNDDEIIIESPPANEIDDREYMYEQQKEIETLEEKILKKEREIYNLKRRIQSLKKRSNGLRNPHDTKTDEQLMEEILSKYIDSDGVQFFTGQMKVSGKTYTQFRWTEEDKLFALGLLYKNPIEYNILFQKYTLPSDKTLNKFVTRIKKAEMEDS